MATNATATAEKTDAAPVVKLQTWIFPQDVKIDSEGQYTKRWRVILPEGMDVSQASEPASWKKVRGSQMHKIAVADRMDLWTADRSQLVEAIVVEVLPKGLLIKPGRAIDMRQESHRYLRIEPYEVRPVADGFAVFNFKTDQRVTNPVTAEKVAERELERLFPRRE